MRAQGIRKYLRPSTIMGRKSTFANAFASALAPHDAYAAETVADALRDLDQDSNHNLTCVYCGKPAATWDHLFNRVVRGDFSGHGHRIRNLVPACRTCNERKGQKSWRDWLRILGPADVDLRVARIERFLAGAASPADPANMFKGAEPELAEFLRVRAQVFDLLREADQLAAIIRQKLAKPEA